jgi:hypothetical protein
MKITVSEPLNQKRPDLYLAREKLSGVLVIVGKYGAIMLDVNCSGNGWSREALRHENFEPLPNGVTVTLEN